MSDSEEGPQQALGRASSSPGNASRDSDVRMREDTNINRQIGRTTTPNGNESDGERPDDGIDADGNDDDDGGLFGSGSEGEAADKEPPPLEDKDLLSEDEGGEVEENGTDVIEEGPEASETTIQDIDIGVHPVPKGSDGEIYILKFPSYLGFNAEAWSAKTPVPSNDHHQPPNLPPSSTFSPSAVARSTLRWKRSQNDRSRLISNARIIRWSDGSLTLQSGANPTEQLELSATFLAPPHPHPSKPTPNSGSSRFNHNTKLYDPERDSYTYVASTSERASVLRTTNHITTALSVIASSTAKDDALTRLNTSMANATRSQASGGLQILSVTEDPDLARKKAEIAEREQAKAQKKLAQTAAREAERTNRTLDKHGLAKSGGGLTLMDLEDGGRTRRRGAVTTPKKKVARRGIDSDTDEEAGRGMTREDEYDKEDGFLVGSDEEDEVVEEDGEGEEVEEELEEERPRKAKRKESPVTDRQGDSGRGARRRRIVDDEDEDDE